MELKKSDKANLEKRRGIFLEIGFLLALGFVWCAFEWSSKPEEETEQIIVAQEVIEEEIIPITRQEEPPPPPPEPPKVADILDIVADDVVIDDNIDFNAETELDTEIEIKVVEQFEVTEAEEEEEEEVFTIVEDMPMFNGKPADQGFREYIAKNTIYPAVAQENGISGKVFLEFTINTKGELVDAKVLRSVDPLLDAEALRVVKSSPKWTPGKQRGKNVKVKYTFPVVFKLNN